VIFQFISIREPEFSVTLGVFGVTTQDTPFLSPQCGPTVRFDPVVPVALQQTQQLRTASSLDSRFSAAAAGPTKPADIVLALTHLSFAEDLKLVRYF
jgi:hypothetical protein